MNALALLLLGALASVPHPDPVPSVHPLHLTVGKLLVQEGRAELDIRIFWDDLQIVTREHSRNPALEVRGGAAEPKAVAAYINAYLVLEFDGVRVPGTLREWSLQGDANAYRLDYPLPSGVREIRIRHRILLDLYEDQKNVLHLSRPGIRDRAFYFARRAEQQSVRL